MNALVHENCEALVTDIATIERRIESIREKMDRYHAALAANQAALSEKINTVHHAVRDKIDEQQAHLSKGQEVLRDKMDAGDKTLRDKIDAVDQKLSEKIDALECRCRARQ